MDTVTLFTTETFPRTHWKGQKGLKDLLERFDRLKRFVFLIQNITNEKCVGSVKKHVLSERL